MVDSQVKDSGNISLPVRLQSPNVEEMDSDDEENYPTIINMQTALYEAVIKDLEQRIDRLQSKNEQLENFCETIKYDSKYKNVNAESQIVELNENITTVTTKVNDLKKKCTEYETLRKEERLNHLEKMKQMEEKFQKTRTKFYSNLKVINSRLNIIEDFKLVEEKLREKYERRNKLILTKKEEMLRIFSQIDYKSKIHNINLKKECYKEILNVSENFQSELKNLVPHTVQRIMRESIVLENELIRLWNDHSNMEDRILSYEDHTDEFTKKIKEAKINTRRRIITSRIQSLLLKKLRGVHQVVEKELSTTVEPQQNFAKRYLDVLEYTKSPEFLTVEYQKRKLEILLHREKINFHIANTFKMQTKYVLKNCYDLINHLTNIVQSALSNNFSVDERFKNMDCETFSLYLLDIIDEFDSKKWLTNRESVETFNDVENIYAVGDLGFEPKHIEIEDETIKKIDRVHSISIKSTFAILKELAELAGSSIKGENKSLDSHDSFYVSVHSDISTNRKSTEKENKIDMESTNKDLIYEDTFESDGSEYEYEMLEELDYYLNYKQE